MLISNRAMSNGMKAISSVTIAISISIVVIISNIIYLSIVLEEITTTWTNLDIQLKEIEDIRNIAIQRMREIPLIQIPRRARDSTKRQLNGERNIRKKRKNRNIIGRRRIQRRNLSEHKGPTFRKSAYERKLDRLTSPIYNDMRKQCVCSMERECPRGPPGPPGIRGENGINGEPGIVGLRGMDSINITVQRIPSSCSICPPGIDGLPGEEGPLGMPGQQGVPGMPGSPGRNGMPGSPGEMGLPGRPGRKGKPGSVGRPGLNGYSSYSEPGLKGPSGAEGPRGEKGIDGLDNHERGSVGPVGPPGEPGYPGPAGIEGKRGPSGPPGPRGSSVCHCKPFVEGENSLFKEISQNYRPLNELENESQITHLRDLLKSLDHINAAERNDTLFSEVEKTEAEKSLENISKDEEIIKGVLHSDGKTGHINEHVEITSDYVTNAATISEQEKWKRKEEEEKKVSDIEKNAGARTYASISPSSNRQRLKESVALLTTELRMSSTTSATVIEENTTGTLKGSLSSTMVNESVKTKKALPPVIESHTSDSSSVYEAIVVLQRKLPRTIDKKKQNAVPTSINELWTRITATPGRSLRTRHFISRIEQSVNSVDNEKYRKPNVTLNDDEEISTLRKALLTSRKTSKTLQFRTGRNRKTIFNVTNVASNSVSNNGPQRPNNLGPKLSPTMKENFLFNVLKTLPNQPISKPNDSKSSNQPTLRVKNHKKLPINTVKPPMTEAMNSDKDDEKIYAIENELKRVTEDWSGTDLLKTNKTVVSTRKSVQKEYTDKGDNFFEANNGQTSFVPKRFETHSIDRFLQNRSEISPNHRIKIKLRTAESAKTQKRASGGKVQRVHAYANKQSILLLGTKPISMTKLLEDKNGARSLIMSDTVNQVPDTSLSKTIPLMFNTSFVNNPQRI